MVECSLTPPQQVKGHWQEYFQALMNRKGWGSVEEVSEISIHQALITMQLREDSRP